MIDKCLFAYFIRDMKYCVLLSRTLLSRSLSFAIALWGALALSFGARVKMPMSNDLPIRHLCVCMCARIT